MHQAAIGDKSLAPGEALDIMACLAQHEPEHLADTGHGLPPIPGGGVLVLGGLDDAECDLTKPRIVVGDARQVACGTFWHGRIGKALGNTVVGGFVGARFATGWQVLRAVRVLHVREACGACVCQRPTAPEQGTGGAHRGGRDVGLREQTAAEQGSNLGRVDRVMFGFAAMDGLHVERMPEDTRATCVGTQGGQPVPGEQTRDGDHYPLSIRSNGL